MSNYARNLEQECGAKVERLQAEIRALRSALYDIAYSEPIPTPYDGWKFCRDIASVALAPQHRDAAASPILHEESHHADK